MDRYPRRPRVPFIRMQPVDYLWWAFLVVFRIWLFCQLVTGGCVLIYRLMSPSFRDFMFANYIDLWNRYSAHLVPDWVGWMPMWYEPEAYPAIAVLLALRLLEIMRRLRSDKPIASRAFDRMSAHPRREKTASTWSTHPETTHVDDDVFAFDSGRFHEPDHNSAPEEPLQIESFETRVRQYSKKTACDTPRDAKDQKAARLLRDPRTPQAVREATLRLLERRHGRGGR